VIPGLRHQRAVRVFDQSMLGSNRVFQNTSFPVKNAMFTRVAGGGDFRALLPRTLII